MASPADSTWENKIPATRKEGTSDGALFLFVVSTRSQEIDADDG